MNPPAPDTREPLAIVVMGVSGSGKSTLGTLLARALHCPFLEGDDFHDAAAIAKMRNGHPLADADRWPWLDRLGHALGRTAATNGCAVATCSALRRAYRDRLIAAASGGVCGAVSGGAVRFILLDNDRDELLRRVSDRPGHYMPPTLLDSQLDTLERPAGDEMVLSLSSRATPQALCEAAVAWLRRG